MKQHCGQARLWVWVDERVHGPFPAVGHNPRAAPPVAHWRRRALVEFKQRHEAGGAFRGRFDDVVDCDRVGLAKEAAVDVPACGRGARSAAVFQKFRRYKRSASALACSPDLCAPFSAVVRDAEDVDRRRCGMLEVRGAVDWAKEPGHLGLMLRATPACKLFSSKHHSGQHHHEITPSVHH